MASTELKRIVSLEPSVTATLFALGRGKRLVAVSEWCERLADVIHPEVASPDAT
jgi:ABC-type hemin transport system substrate-binding protein